MPALLNWRRWGTCPPSSVSCARFVIPPVEVLFYLWGQVLTSGPHNLICHFPALLWVPFDFSYDSQIKNSGTEKDLGIADGLLALPTSAF
jgi:hypothetical protein